MKKLYFPLSIITVFVFYSSVVAQNKKAFPIPGKKNSEFKNENSPLTPQNLIVPYVFSYSTGTYNDLTGSVSLNNGITWDDPNFLIPIGFNFILWNDTIDSLMTADLGGMLIPSVIGIKPFTIYACDVTDRGSDTINWDGMPGSLSTISYLVSGTPGTRILKVEWKNAGFYNDIYDDNTSTDYVNLQMWLYETSNNIEIRFGPNSILQDSVIYEGYSGPGVGVGLYDFNVDTLDFFCIHGNAAAPSDTTIDENGWAPLAGDPPNGIIYKFSWFFVGINELENQNHIADVYPNPVGDYAEVHWKATSFPENARIEIADMLGRIAYHQIASFDNDGRINIPVSLLTSGSYILKITSENRVVFKKLVKE